MTDIKYPHVFPECISVGSQGLRVSVFDERNNLLDSPAGRVLPCRAFALAAVRTVGWAAQRQRWSCGSTHITPADGGRWALLLHRDHRRQAHHSCSRRWSVRGSTPSCTGAPAGSSCCRGNCRGSLARTGTWWHWRRSRWDPLSSVWSPPAAHTGSHPERESLLEDHQCHISLGHAVFLTVSAVFFSTKTKQQLLYLDEQGNI